jgi:hypothetical protein
MAVGEEYRSLDLFSVRSELRMHRQECIAFLAQGVEAATNGQLSVRETVYANILGAPMGISNLFVAVCSASTPGGVLASLTEDMTPYIIAPGAGLGCAKAERA